MTHVYVGNAASQDISVLELQQDGELKLVQTVVVPGPEVRGDSLPLTVSPDKRFLFAAVRGGPYSVVTFGIQGLRGRLRLLGSGPLPDSMAYVTTDRRGHFLLAASYQGSKLTVSPIGRDGVVGEPLQEQLTRPKAHCVFVASSNRHVLATSLGGDGIHQLRFDLASGRLVPNEPPFVSLRRNAGARHLVFSPDERFVYVINELDGGIDALRFDASTGTLREKVRVGSSLPTSFSGTPWAADIHLTPDGRFLYTSERTSSTLAAFKVDVERGRLTPIGWFATVSQPRAFAIDPSGRYLLAAGQRSDSVRSYSIDPKTGSLTPRGDVQVGKNPGWIDVLQLP